MTYSLRTNLFLWIFICICISASAAFSTSSIGHHAATSNSSFHGAIRFFLTAEPASSLISQESLINKRTKEKATSLIKQEQETAQRTRAGSKAARGRMVVRSTGPGSSPPRCTSKCGRCKPCKAVHVAVPPGTPVPTEYYPEAWRCKCGNRLFIP